MNVLGLRAGHSETPLTKAGKNQAMRAGKIAKKLAIDCIVCSPLERTQQTARIIAKQIGYDTNNILTNQLLIERYFGSLEGQPWDPFKDIESQHDIEQVDDLLKRANRVLDWLKTIDASNILVVSHGAFGRALRSLLIADIPFDSPVQIPNAQIVRWL